MAGMIETGTMRYLATILITLFLAAPAKSVELFRYRGAAKDGGTLEYVFEAGEQHSPDAVTKEWIELFGLVAVSDRSVDIPLTLLGSAPEAVGLGQFRVELDSLSTPITAPSKSLLTSRYMMQRYLCYD